MDKKIIIHSSEDGDVCFDTEEEWFCFVKCDGNVDSVDMIRYGWFDFSEEETAAVSKWIMGLINGVLQN